MRVVISQKMSLGNLLWWMTHFVAAFNLAAPLTNRFGQRTVFCMKLSKTFPFGSFSFRNHMYYVSQPIIFLGKVLSIRLRLEGDCVRDKPFVSPPFFVWAKSSSVSHFILPFLSFFFLFNWLFSVLLLRKFAEKWRITMNLTTGIRWRRTARPLPTTTR